MQVSFYQRRRKIACFDLIARKCSQKKCSERVFLSSHCKLHPPLHYAIRRTQITQHGKRLSFKGLFAKGQGLVFRKNQIIARCDAERLTQRQALKRYQGYSGCFLLRAIEKNHVWDMARRRCAASFANSVKIGTSAKIPNAYFLLRKHSVPLLCASKPIYANEEILVNYGTQYWKHNTLRHKIHRA